VASRFLVYPKPKTPFDATSASYHIHFNRKLGDPERTKRAGEKQISVFDFLCCKRSFLKDHHVVSGSFRRRSSSYAATGVMTNMIFRRIADSPPRRFE
jgi:hypothetical protein